MVRGCALIDSRLDTAKIGSDGRVEVHRARLRAVFGGRKTFPHGLDPTRTWPGNFAVTHKTLPFGDVLECLLDLREDQRGGAISLRSLATVPSSCGSRRPRHGRHGRTATVC